jgi:hypothetical protein
MVTKIRYKRRRQQSALNAIIMIQTMFRTTKQRRKFRKIKNVIMKLQANVLSRQFRKAFLNTKNHVTTCQMYIKRNLAMKWFSNLKNKKRQLDENLHMINSLIHKHNDEATTFKHQIKDYGNAYEGYEVNEVKKSSRNEGNYSEMSEELKKLLDENRTLQEELQRKEQYQYEEESKNQNTQNTQLNGMIAGLKDNLDRVEKDVKMSKKLPIKMQHAYKYSKWDSINEPYNVVENTLKEDDTVYKALAPDLDFTLNNGRK